MMAEKESGEGFAFRDRRNRGEDEESAPAPAAPAERSAAPSGIPPGPSAKEQNAAQQAADAAGPTAPPIDFSTFILSMAQSAVYHMGGFQDPVSGHTSTNLDLAKQTIDIISLLEGKTRGNLTEDEKRLLSHVLYDLRMRFVEAVRNPGAA